MQKFGKRIRELRHARSMTLDEVRLKVKISRAYLSGIENGRVNPPAAPVVRGLAKALGVDPKELLLLATVEKAPHEIREDLERAVVET